MSPHAGVGWGQRWRRGDLGALALGASPLAERPSEPPLPGLPDPRPCTSTEIALEHLIALASPITGIYNHKWQCRQTRIPIQRRAQSQAPPESPLAAWTGLESETVAHPAAAPVLRRHRPAHSPRADADSGSTRLISRCSAGPHRSVTALLARVAASAWQFILPRPDAHSRFDETRTRRGHPIPYGHDGALEKGHPRDPCGPRPVDEAARVPR